MPIETLRLAFRLHIAELIVGADAEVHPQEVAHLAFLFPAQTLQDSGLIDEAGEKTDAYVDAAMEALETLPDLLTQIQKVEMLTEFMGAVLADGEFDRAEGAALVTAAHLLEVPDALIQDFLDAHVALGGIKLAELDDED